MSKLQNNEINIGMLERLEDGVSELQSMLTYGVRAAGNATYSICIWEMGSVVLTYVLLSMLGGSLLVRLRLIGNHACGHVRQAQSVHDEFLCVRCLATQVKNSLEDLQTQMDKHQSLREKTDGGSNMRTGARCLDVVLRGWLVVLQHPPLQRRRKATVRSVPGLTQAQGSWMSSHNGEASQPVFMMG